MFTEAKTICRSVCGQTPTILSLLSDQLTKPVPRETTMDQFI